MKDRCFAALVLLAVAASHCVSGLGAAVALELDLPVDCTLGEDCFVQQFPDMDPGPNATDPFCGTATYDRHSGTDLRVLSMKDVARGVAVLAMADGEVLRVRDGEPDKLALTSDERKAVESQECGNGVIVRHVEDVVSQYCHLKQGSVSVKAGETVRRGQQIGAIGASGLAQFPHVHVTVRRRGLPIDPSSGTAVGGSCKRFSSEKALFSEDALKRLGQGEAELLSFGLSGGTVAHTALALSGPPTQANTSSPAIVGWAWVQNLKKGDRISVEVSAPDGNRLASGLTEPMDRPKASYSSFAGKRAQPLPGTYSVTVKLLRNGRAIFDKAGTFEVK